MAILIGIDEAGYGPHLGPLVVSAAACASADPDVDLWDALREVTVKGPRRDDRIPVADSKRLFHPELGLRVLEEAALPFLSCLGLPRPVGYPDFHRFLLGNSDGVSLTAPWYQNASLLIPTAIPIEELTRLTHRLRQGFARAGITFAAVRSRMADVGDFNAGIRRTGNKSEFLFACFSDLLGEFRRTFPSDDLIFHVGKHGGKTFYQRNLRAHFFFQALEVVRENRKQSTYRVRDQGRTITIHFLMDGEDRDFLIALASCVSKYLRELSMSLFNRYWQQHIPGLRPTAGYGTDARRFLRAIRSRAATLRIHDDVLVRSC
jgi:ribonuclease HII